MTDSANPYRRLLPRADESGLVNVIIVTPRGSANKYNNDDQLGVFNSYNRARGRTLRIVSRFNARRAHTLQSAAIKAHRGTAT